MKVSWQSALAGFLTLLALFSSPALATVVNYDIVYVRQPRYGPSTNTIWPEVFHPARLDPGADLMLLHTNGTEEVLVPGGNGGVTDPFISFDAQWCYYSFYPDLRTGSLNYQRADLPHSGCDIYRIQLQTRVIQRLTFQEFTPNTGAGKWNYTNPASTSYQKTSLGYGILNLGPCPIAGGKVAFVSNRDGYTP